MLLLRLTCPDFYVDVRVKEVRSVWVVSADTPDGPSLPPLAESQQSVRVYHHKPAPSALDHKALGCQSAQMSTNDLAAAS